MKYHFLAAGVTALGLLASPAMAGDQDFTLVNATGYDIAEVYASPVRAGRWGKDIMGSDMLNDGEHVNISFPHAANACHWDLKVVYDDKDTAVWNDFNLCEISKITLKWNRKAGTTTAFTE